MIALEGRPVAVTSSVGTQVSATARPGPARLLSGDLGRAMSLVAHRGQFRQPPPLDGISWRALGRLVEESGLAGRGGAGFPTAQKIAAASSAGASTVVVNGTEGEPASRKDAHLMVIRPQLVLDGAMLAAAATGATDIVVCVSRDRPDALAAMRSALAERAASGEAVEKVRLAATPPRYVAGEESALVAWLNGGDAKPAGASRRPFERGVQNRPTLVQNVESLANLPLLAKYGPQWFRQCGTAAEPGTRLVTVAVAPDRYLVMEAECGAPLADLMTAAAIPCDAVQAVLVGGYFGSWLSGPSAATSARLSAGDLARFGAHPGAGVLIPIPRHACGVASTARILRWYAGESAGQCGPCRYGLPDLASVFSDISAGRAGAGALELLDRYSANIEGRGACRHPDGAVRLLRSARVVFAEDLALHLAGVPCAGATAPSAIAVPRPGAVWR